MEGIEAAFVGKLALDPEARVSAGGKTWTRLPVVIGYGDAATWVSVACFGPIADRASAIERGSSVYIEGKLSLSTWTKDGKERAGLNVAASRIEVLGRIGKKRPEKAKEAAPEPAQPDMLPAEERRQARARAQSETTQAWEAAHAADPGIPF